MSKPRGKTPSLISGSSGKPAIRSSLRKTNCSRCDESIIAGDKCVDIPKVGGAFSSKKRVCLGCFENIIEQTKRDVALLEESLD